MGLSFIVLDMGSIETVSIWQTIESNVYNVCYRVIHYNYYPWFLLAFLKSYSFRTCTWWENIIRRVLSDEAWERKVMLTCINWRNAARCIIFLKYWTICMCSLRKTQFWYRVVAVDLSPRMEHLCHKYHFLMAQFFPNCSTTFEKLSVIMIKKNQRQQSRVWTLDRVQVLCQVKVYLWFSKNGLAWFRLKVCHFDFHCYLMIQAIRDKTN